MEHDGEGEEEEEEDELWNGRHIIFIVSVNCYAPSVRHIWGTRGAFTNLNPLQIIFLYTNNGVHDRIRAYFVYYFVTKEEMNQTKSSRGLVTN